jgi:hypothetical protein
MSDDSNHTLEMEFDEDREDDGGDLDEDEEEEDDVAEGDDIDGTWPDQETSRIIELFRSNPQLYDVSHPAYPNRDKKLMTFSRISKELECSSKLI